MNTFRNAIRNEDFLVTASLPVTGASTRDDMCSNFDELLHCVQALQIDAERTAEGAPDALAIAALARQRGIDTVVHLTARDRNRLALKSALQGLAALGVDSVVLTRGQKLPDELRGKVKGVFDTSTVQLVEMARQIGEQVLPGGSGFFIGARVSVIRPGADWRADAALKRIDAGCGFLLSQPCLNAEMLQDYLRALVALRVTHRASVIVDVPVLADVAAVARIAADYPGSRIPETVQRRLAAAADPRAEGIAIAADMLRRCREMPGVAGVNLVADEAAAVAELLAAAG